MFSCFRIQNVEENIQNNDNQPIPIIDTSENNDDAEMYNKVYNKLFLVSTEFSKIKQRIQNMEIKTNNNEIETIELKKELVYLKNDNNSKFINTKIDSINDNTVLFMSISNLTETKKKFIQDIQENTAYTNIVFGIDHKYSSSLNTIKEMMKNNNEVIVLDYLELIGKYTSKF